MTSPVDTAVKWARSSMPGAPTLTRAAGSLTAVLDALLVNGWGMQTASSVVVAGGVATATFPSDHAAARHAVVVVAGVTGALAGLNGEQKVTSVAANIVKWATTEDDGTATGTITIKMAPAGWAKVFTGTNLAVYQSLSPDKHGQFLRVNDTTAGHARVVGYETMTGISTGTGLFPSSAQLSGGYYWGKNEDTTGTAATTYLFGSDGRVFYFFPQASYTYQGAVPGQAQCVAPQIFGDLLPLSPAGDPFATLITGGTTTNWSFEGARYVFDYNSPDYMLAVPRPISGVGASLRGLVIPELNLGAHQSQALPDPVTGAIPFGKVHYRDTNASFPRAYFPGLLYCPARFAELITSPQDIIELPSGKALATAWVGDEVNATGSASLVGLDITSPWR